jgi:acyl carrier protein
MTHDPRLTEERILSLLTEASKHKRGRTAMMRDLRLQRDLGIDSIGLLGLLMRFEEVFGVTIASDDLGAYAGRIRTVGDAIEVGEEMLRKTRPAGQP